MVDNPEDFKETVGLDGLFNDDGITPLAPPGVPLGFDLTQLLSESFRSRAAWDDLARVASRVLYEYFDRHRIALELSRSPENISRVIKIATLKMLGLDWRSDNLSDEDYDRLIATISEYQQNHGPQDFVRYIGFALGVPMELIPLWTRDYGTFVPGPDFKLTPIWKGGTWYPTSHVGLLYEEFAENADKVEEEEIRNVFYKMAPIHLVLDWIASEVTLRVGPLYMSLATYESSEDTAIVDDKPLTLLIETLPFESGEDTLLLFPDAPVRNIGIDVMAAGSMVGEDRLVTKRPGIDWDPLIPFESGGIVASLSGESLLSTDTDGTMSIILEPAPLWRGWNFEQYGALANPLRLGYVANSGNPLAPTWLRDHDTVFGLTTYKKTPLYTLTVTNQSPIQTLDVPQGTNVVTWAFQKISGSKFVALVRGTQRIAIDMTTLQIYPTGGVTKYGIKSHGSNFYTVWAVMTGSNVTAYPAWGNFAIGEANAAGVIAWYNLQVENALYPSTSFRASAIVPYTRQDTQFDFANADQLNYPFGFVSLDVVPSFDEWTVAEQTVLDARNILGQGIKIIVGTDGLVRFDIKLHNFQQSVVSPVTASPLTPLHVGYRWDAIQNTVRLHAEYWNADVAVPWLSNFRYASVLHPHGSAVTAQWTMRRALATGYNDPALVPNDTLMNWIFGN